MYSGYPNQQGNYPSNQDPNFQTQYSPNHQNAQFQRGQSGQQIPTTQFGGNPYQNFVPTPETQQYQQPQPNYSSHLPDQYQHHVHQPMTDSNLTGFQQQHHHSYLNNQFQNMHIHNHPQESNNYASELSKHIPFNMQRGDFQNTFTYADSSLENQKPEETPAGVQDGSAGPLRVSLIQSMILNNPYFYNQDRTPCIEDQMKPHVKDPAEEQQALQEDKQRLKNKVFAFFTQKDTEMSQFMVLLGQIKMSGEKYTDDQFPPNLNSLMGANQMRKAEWGDTVWFRPDDFYGAGSYEIFQGKIEPNDIRQGALGDCYFLSTISSMAEWPERIKQIFVTKQVNTCGCYCVKVCEMGEWKEVIVDDCFPCDKYTKKPIFTKGNDKELWVLILEKVWAKIYASYDAIEAGLTRECLHDFTGAPTKFFLTDRKEEWEMIWRKITKAEKKQYIMACGAGEFFSQTSVNIANSKGIVSSHAYSLLAATEVDTPQGRVRLVRLRNPWGKTEWKGAWGDTSPEWTSQLKAQLGWENRDDGVFFMAYEDFLKFFDDIQVCYVRDLYKYNYQRITSNSRHAVYLKMTVQTEGKYYITVNQQSKRKNRSNPNFKYSTVSLIVSRLTNNNKYEYVTGNNRADREVWGKGVFTPGEYLIYAKSAWTSETDGDFVISSYGPSNTTFEKVSKTSYPTFLEETFISKGRISNRRVNYAREGEANCSSVVDMSRDGFTYCYYNNMSTRTLETEVYFKEFQGVKLRKPFRGRGFTIRVPPYQEKAVLLRIIPNKDVRQVLSEKVRFLDG